ncbi:hypothetical protein, partial [Alistipes communis]|uniref:hypothetical protein n=1 Tax=Alistipes communis TaxID=2585118 RepID=UPI00307BB6F1
KREQCQIYLNIAEREYLRHQPKIRKVERRSKRQLDYAEAKYPPDVSQRYESAAASPAARFQKERNEGFFMVRS